MEKMAKRRLLHITLFLLLSSGSTLAHDGARQGDSHMARLFGGHIDDQVVKAAQGAREVLSEPNVMAMDYVERLEQSHRQLERKIKETERELRRRRSPTEAEAAQITTPPISVPELLKRQDQAQIDDLNSRLQSAQQSANDALQALSQQSRQVSQSSQQLSQQSQQLSQSSTRLESESRRLSQSLQQAQQSAQQAGDAARQASQSATQAISSAESSANSAISAAIASVTSSAGQSAASLISAASDSAKSIMDSAASMVQQAQADATLARADAQNQVVQAQGTAVSVTQAAIAIVASILGSSLLTILAFWCVLRVKRDRRRRSRELKGDISYPQSQEKAQGAYDAPTAYGANGYPQDVKGPLSPARTSTSSRYPPDMGGGAGGEGGDGGNNGVASGIGYATSYDNRSETILGNPPPAAARKTNQFTLFPRSTPQSSSAVPQSGGSRSSIPPSLQTWLKAGTVSPFGTLEKNGTAPQRTVSPAWPLERPSGAGIGVGGVNTTRSGGGPSGLPSGVQPRKLPLRDD